MNLRPRIFAFIVAGVTLAASGWIVRSALAEGIPPANALTYTGVLEDSAGVPLSGSDPIEIEVYKVATGWPRGACAERCTRPEIAPVEHFSGPWSFSVPDDLNQR